MADSVKLLLQAATEDRSQTNTKLLLILKEESKTIDDEDFDNVMKLLSQDGTDISVILNVIADIAKIESNRLVLTKDLLIQKLLNHISNDDLNITLQALRSLCNICADNDKARTYFSTADGVNVLISKADKVLESDDDSWNKLICPIFSCIQNIVSDSDELQEEFAIANAITSLWNFAEKFHTSDQNTCIFAITGIGGLIDSEIGLKKFEENDIAKKLLDFLKTSNDEIIGAIVENILSELGGKENGRVLLCKCNTVQLLSELIEARSNYKEVECTDELMKKMADLVVVLTSGEESFTILEKSDKDLLQRFSSWIESPNKHIQVSAGLALGNYTRSDETCAALINNKIHENLINVIKENIDDESYTDRFQAFTSCLRNLTIPVPNKTILIEAGLSEISVTLVKKSALPVQFKALAILRLLLQGHADLANKLLSDEELLKKICDLSEATVVSSVPSEAQRLIAALVKYSNSPDCVRNALSCNALKPINSLLSSEHPLMQNEGLIGLIMTAANIHDCLPQVTDAECLPKVVKLMNQDGVQAQTIFNGLTFLQALSSLDGSKALLQKHHVKELLEKLKNHSEDIIRSKSTETIDVLSLE